MSELKWVIWNAGSKVELKTINSDRTDQLEEIDEFTHQKMNKKKRKDVIIDEISHKTFFKDVEAY